ncbi:MAG: hypothetical protein IPK26_20740 [Planctomycetes bacterium]|nr:hypothetical protein [Planctomycetota bacterium]
MALAANGRLVLFGGSAGPFVFFADTWLWDGTDWTPWTAPPGSSTPTGRTSHGMAFDIGLGRTVMESGYSSQRDVTWLFDDRGWRAVPMPSATVRQRHNAAFAYDASVGQVVAFGGWDGSLVQAADDTWGYAAGFATWSPFGVGCAGTSGVPTLAVTTLPWLPGTLTVQLGNVPATPGLGVLVTGWSDRQWSGGPLPFDFGPLGVPGCHGFVSPDAHQALATSTGTATVLLSIPASPQLFGMAFYQQGVVLDVSAAGFAMSPAAEGFVGS